jgi:hypothetical protein
MNDLDDDKYKIRALAQKIWRRDFETAKIERLHAGKHRKSHF